MRTKVSSETFISNFHELKQKLRVPLPNDEIVFQCEQCHGNIAFNYEGVIEFDEMMDKELSSYVDHMILATIKAHKTQTLSVLHQTYGFILYLEHREI